MIFLKWCLYSSAYIIKAGEWIWGYILSSNLGLKRTDIFMIFIDEHKLNPHKSIKQQFYHHTVNWQGP